MIFCTLAAAAKGSAAGWKGGNHLAVLCLDGDREQHLGMRMSSRGFHGVCDARREPERVT